MMFTVKDEKIDAQEDKMTSSWLYHSRRAELDVGPGSCLMVHSVTSCFWCLSGLVKLKDETPEM